MRITRIVRQKRKKDRVSIFVDGKYSFSVSEQTLLDEKITDGIEITEERINSIKESEEKQKAADSVFRLLGIRARSEKELREKLKTKNINAKNVEFAIDRVRKLGYINDEKFARERINILRQKGKGPFVIRMELRKAGIKEELINDSLSESGPEKFDEVNQIKNIALAKLKRMGKTDNRTKSNKLIGFLSRRGFNIESIKEGLKLAKLEIEQEQ